MDRFRSLTARLVLTAVALVAIVCVLVGSVTTVFLRGQLVDQLDGKVLGATEGARRVLTSPPGGIDPDRDGDYGNLGPGTLVALLDANPDGVILADRAPDNVAISADSLETLAGVPVDRRVHQVQIEGKAYRVHVVGFGGSKIVAGLPLTDVNDTVSRLVLAEMLVSLLAIASAGGVGTFLVRRQLRPLREVAATAHAVAELPLASGAITLDERVPEHLTDARTEVGQVGAALNTLLDHVGSSLQARHKSEQQVRQFVADASHELRTPLTTIAGYTELARRRPGDRGASDMALAKVEEESGRMTALVEDLLLLARLDSGRPLERTTVDLTRLLVEAVNDQRVLAPDHHWRLSLPEDSVEVDGDEHRLHQVVTNLLTNARKYTPAGTTVTVSAYSSGPGGGAGFAVHDDGPGFPPDLVGHAFERFARGDLARTRSNGDKPGGGGYGLGLSLVHAIVTAHGGTVDLRSTPGDTTVSVHLP